MKRRHALLTSILLGLAAVAGALALTRTMALGQSTGASDVQIERRAAALDRAEAQVRRLRAQRPPRLPAAPARAAAATRVVVLRAAPATTHGAGQEHDDDAGGRDTEDGGGWDD